METQSWKTLPSKLFISHSYKDELGKKALIKRLPAHINPVFFPFQEPNPDFPVSNGIVKEIFEAGALIYLKDQYAVQSIWVNFELDYALRIGKPVFVFDVEKDALLPYKRKPIPLEFSLVIGRQNEQQARALVNWMRQERHFDFRYDPIRVRMKEIPGLVAELLQEGKVVVWLMDSYLKGVASLAFKVDDYLVHEFPIYEHRKLDSYQQWLRDHSLFVKLTKAVKFTDSNDPEIKVFIRSEYPIEGQFAAGWGVDLTSEIGEHFINWNRADDLIVRLTLMIQQAKPFFEEEE